MKPYQNDKSTGPIIIGYYPFRAKAQIPRLLCEFLHLSYVDKFFNPQDWQKFKANKAKDWVIQDLPFLIDGNFITTSFVAIVVYIIEKAGKPEMLGQKLEHRIKIDNLKSKHDLKNAILGLICRPFNSQQGGDTIEIWRNKVEPILLSYQNQCPQNGWYYGYITLMDFVVYELVNLMMNMFSKELFKYKKMKNLHGRFKQIPQIRNYQLSNRAVSEYSPIVYFEKFKEAKMRVANNRMGFKMQQE